jgi:uncharacterized protein YciI
MFVILLDYIQPLADIDRLVGEHRKFLERHYARGDFLLSGRQEPRTGGVIVARARSKEAVQRMIEEDPFFIEQVATYRLIEFIPTMTAPELDHLKVAT